MTRQEDIKEKIDHHLREALNLAWVLLSENHAGYKVELGDCQSYIRCDYDPGPWPGAPVDTFPYVQPSGDLDMDF